MEIKIIPWDLWLYRFPDGSVGIDVRGMKWLNQWLTDKEMWGLVDSLSDQRLSRLDYLMRHANP